MAAFVFIGSIPFFIPKILKPTNHQLILPFSLKQCTMLNKVPTFVK